MRLGSRPGNPHGGTWGVRGGEAQVEVRAASILGEAALGGRPEADSFPSEVHCPWLAHGKGMSFVPFTRLTSEESLCP